MAVDLSNGDENGNGSRTNSATLRGNQKNVLQVHYGADLISDCVLTLKLSAATAALSLTIYQRFYMRYTAYDYSPVWISCAAILLATKHDDDISRKLSDVATAVHSTLSVRESWRDINIDININDKEEEDKGKLDYYGAAGYTWKSEIMKAEHLVLHTIGFRILHETPHKLVLVFCNTLREKSSVRDRDVWDGVVRRAWALANDIMRMSTCVTSGCDDIACACIARSGAPGLPANWMGVFGATKEGMAKVSGAFDILYNAPPLQGRFEDLCNAHIRRACGMKE